MNDFYYAADKSNLFTFVSFFLIVDIFASCTVLNRVVDDDAAK